MADGNGSATLGDADSAGNGRDIVFAVTDEHGHVTGYVKLVTDSDYVPARESTVQSLAQQVESAQSVDEAQSESVTDATFQLTLIIACFFIAGAVCVTTLLRSFERK